VAGAVLYLLGAANEGWYLGRRMFIENLVSLFKLIIDG